MRYLHRPQGNAGGRPYTWEIEVTEHLPGERLAWSCLGGPCQDWTVSFTSLPGERTQVTLTLDCDPQSYSARKDTVSPEALWADLERFRHLVETQGGQLAQDAEERAARREQSSGRERTVGG